MNASEDGQPMGEAPELDWVTLAMQADQIMTGQQGLLEQQAQIIAEVTALHRRVETDGDATYCWECRDLTGRRTPWPCDTMRIVERVAL